MRIIYLGTPEFSVKPLEKLISLSNHQIVAVITNPDRPVGRKRIVTPPPVKVVAQANGLVVYQYEKIKNEGVAQLKKLNPDIMITCAFGQILSQEILDIPKIGVFNIHASLLPKYRGASPIQQALLNGDNVTGITIMKTDIGVDTGDILLQKSIKVNENETCGELFDRLSTLGADAIEQALEIITSGDFSLVKQNDLEATHCKMIKKEDAIIDFNQSADIINNKIRAFNPWPIAFLFQNGAPFKIYSAKVVDYSGKPSEILRCENELVIACGEKALSLIKVQKAGGKPMDIKDYLRGAKLKVGDFFIND